MNAPKTLLEGIKFAKDQAVISNQSNIDVFMHLKALSITEVWKKDSFYNGAENLIHYRKKKFGALMYDIYGRSTTWFRNMNAILSLNEGMGLYLKYGHANMVAFMAFSPENQEYVLKTAEKRPTSNFHAILNSAGLKGKNLGEKSKADIENAWKKKYSDLEKKYKVLKDKNKNLLHEIRTLKNKQKKVKDIMQSI